MRAQRTVLLWRCEGRCGALSTGTAHPLVFEHLAPFHHKRNVFQDAHVGERVGRHRHQIGIKARLELPDPIFPAQQLGRVQRGRLNRSERLHAQLDQRAELAAIHAMRIHRGVSAKRNLYARSDRFCEVLLGFRSHFARFLGCFL